MRMIKKIIKAKILFWKKEKSKYQMNKSKRIIRKIIIDDIILDNKTCCNDSIAFHICYGIPDSNQLQFAMFY